MKATGRQAAWIAGHDWGELAARTAMGKEGRTQQVTLQLPADPGERKQYLLGISRGLQVYAENVVIDLAETKPWAEVERRADAGDDQALDALHEQQDPMADMRARWLPTREAVAIATAKLSGRPAATLAMIPMCQPGKTRGIWTVGQEVVTVDGVVITATDNDQPGGQDVLPYSTARRIVTDCARAILGDQPGTVAYAVVERDGHVAVFEDR